MGKKRINILVSRFRFGILFILACIVCITFINIFRPNQQAQNKSSKENLLNNHSMPFPRQPDKLKRIPQRIKDTKSMGVEFKRRELFQSVTKKATDDAQLREVLREGVVLNLNKLAVQQVLLDENAEFLTLPLPDGKGGILELELEKVNIFAPGFTVKTSAPTNETFDESLGVHYRGIIKGDDHSLVAISIFRKEVMGFFSTESGGNSVLGRLQGENPNDRHIIYADRNLKVRPNFHCNTTDTNEILPESILQTPEEIVARCVRIYLEANYDLFQAGGSVSSVTTYLTGVFNQSSVLYANEGISISISEIFVWNSPSPYNGTNSLQQLEQFKAIRTSFNGNLAHLITLQSSFGGIAYRPGLCNTGFNYAFSGIDTTYNNVPMYSWTVMVFTHETGHNFGSPHTHACAWNGNGTAIDGCAPTEPNSSCPRPAIPSGGGTMMSYCHLQSVGINFTLGFGPQPHNLIVNNFNNLSCVAECGGGCTYNLSPASQNFNASGGSGSFSVTAGSGCSWTATVNAPAFLKEPQLIQEKNLFSVIKDSTSRSEPESMQVAPQEVFLNSTPININDRTSNSNPPGTPSLYPSTISVSGMSGTITKVEVALNNLSHTYPDDVDVLLVGPGGQRTILMSDAGGDPNLTGVNLTFDQSAASTLPDATQITSGTYRPTNFAGNTSIEPSAVDNFPSPAPGQTNYTTNLSVFNGTAPNGTWRLYVVDDEAADNGNIATGWALGITTSGGGTNWITITSGSSGSGSGTVNYNVATNSGVSQRTGTITVNGQVHTVIQAGNTASACDQNSPISLGQTISGTLVNTDCLVGSSWYTDKYSFSGTAGQQIVIAMNSSAVDSYLILNSPSGQSLMQDNDGGGGANARIPAGSGSFTLPTTGTYIIEASTFSSFQTGAYSVSLTSGGSPPTGRKPFDFDGDSRADISIFRPSNGQWWYQQSSDNVVKAYTFGVSTDKAVPADYDNDGKTDCAFWRPSTGSWFVLRSSNLTFFSAPFGVSTDRPAPGDFDGDGFADLTVFRPSQGVWYILKSTGGVQTTQFGTNGDVPQAVDFDGDSRADTAIYRPSNGQWWVLRSSNGSVFATTFGVSTDKPVSADYTGDGKADCAFWRPSTGQWFVLRSEDLTYYAAQFGSNGDVPVAGDYDGDGRADHAVFRPSGATWFVLKSGGGTLIQSFGLAGDIPAPSAFVP